MKRILTTTTVVPLVLAILLSLTAHEQITSLWTGQSVTSETNVSLTVTGGGSSSSTSSAGSSSSLAGASSSSSDGERPPYGRYRYSEEVTMEKLIPLLRKRFLRPAAPVTPPQIVPPYYPTLPPTRIPSEYDVLRFGKQLQSDMESLLTWPFGMPQEEVDDLHFMPWGPFDAWQWQVTPLATEDRRQDMHPAAGAESWQWVRYISAFLGPLGEPWIWAFFILALITIIACWRKLTDSAVNFLLFIHNNKKQYFGCYEGPPVHPDAFVKDSEK